MIVDPVWKCDEIEVYKEPREGGWRKLIAKFGASIRMDPRVGWILKKVEA